MDSTNKRGAVSSRRRCPALAGAVAPARPSRVGASYPAAYRPGLKLVSGRTDNNKIIRAVKVINRPTTMMPLELARVERLPVMVPYFEHVIGFDPNGIRRIYASTWIEARQEARNHIRNHPDTAPLSAWRFDLV